MLRRIAPEEPLDFQLNEEQLHLKKTVRDFAERERCERDCAAGRNASQNICSANNGDDIFGGANYKRPGHRQVKRHEERQQERLQKRRPCRSPIQRTTARREHGDHSFFERRGKAPVS